MIAKVCPDIDFEHKRGNFELCACKEEENEFTGRKIRT